jgi:hypothetical protein
MRFLLWRNAVKMAGKVPLGDMSMPAADEIAVGLIKDSMRVARRSDHPGTVRASKEEKKADG